MKNLLSNLHRNRHFLYCLLTTWILSCSTVKTTTYKRYWGGEYMQTHLRRTAKVIMKYDNNIILKDETGWIEQTYYKPICKRYNVGDTLFIHPYR